MNKAILVLLVALVTSPGAWAESEPFIYLNGSKLLERCKAYVDETYIAKGGVCIGYVMGIADAHNTYSSWGYLPKQYCAPSEVAGSQLVRVALKHLEEAPEGLHLAASSLVINALTEAFPCP